MTIELGNLDKEVIDKLADQIQGMDEHEAMQTIVEICHQSLIEMLSEINPDVWGSVLISSFCLYQPDKNNTQHKACYVGDLSPRALRTLLTDKVLETSEAPEEQKH